jgi:hypothetical protein
MARSRNIKPGFYANEDLAECSVWARYIFPGLWMLADREGRIEDRPKRIKGELLRYDNVEVEPLLAELEQRGFIVRYAVGNRQLIQVAAFKKHQNPHHREAPSMLPAPSSRELGAAEPEAKPTYDERQTQGVTEADPGQAPGLTRPTPVPAVLIPDSLIPDSEEKQAAPADSVSWKPEAMTAKERVWALGPKVVGGADAGARTFLGKLVSAHGEEIVDAALSACAIEQPGGPRPWLIKTCEAKAKFRDARTRGSVDLTGDDKPRWAVNAGFANKYEAGNEGCFEHNAAKFGNGKRVEAFT